MTNASMTFGRPIRSGSFGFSHLTAIVLRGLHRLDQWQLAEPRQAEPQTAQEVLAYAQQIEASDPGFASDLRAAALRAQQND